MRVSDGRRVKKSEGITSSNSIETKINRGNKVLDGSEKKLDKLNKQIKKEVKVNIDKVKSENPKPNEHQKSSNKSNDKNNKAGRESNTKKNKQDIERTLGKLSAGRIVAVVFVGIISSIIISGFVYGLYFNLVRYPRQMEVDIENSGLGGINRFVDAIESLDNEKIKSITGEDSYLVKELEYANGDEDKIAFIKKMVETVSYEPRMVQALNMYGNTMLERGTDEIVYTDSLVNDTDEKVRLHYIDYSKVKLDVEKIKELMKEGDLKVGDVDYSNKLVTVFCKYMVSLKEKDIPLVNEPHTPSLVKTGSKYNMTSEEDVALDKKLFSSDEFFKFLEKFSVVASGDSIENPEWTEWNKLSKEEKEKKEEPQKVISELKPLEEWVAWNSKTDEEKKTLPEPEKYDEKKIISMDWCGAYYLNNEYEVLDENGNKVKKQISAEVGDGTIKNPAGLNTDIVTSIFVLEKQEDGSMKRVAKPVRVRLVNYKVSQDAIDYFESKDERNRGFDVKSELQYASYTFEVTNLSSTELNIYDDSSLADEQANLSPRTGKIFGLQEEVTLKPDQTGIIESWGCSTELNTKYLIWGSDFQREEDVVWFRVLAGDIDDPSEDKGVSLNKSRYEDEEEEDITYEETTEE